MPNIRQTERTTIAIHRETLYRLVEIGKFNESYEDVINRLLDENTTTREKMGCES